MLSHLQMGKSGQGRSKKRLLEKRYSCERLRLPWMRIGSLGDAAKAIMQVDKGAEGRS